VDFTFNGKRFSGHPGDTLASALMANGQRIVGRSFKYHRPRGIVASGGEEPNALVNLGSGATHEPNQRATTTELFDGLTATSQNHWPSLEWDIGEVNAALARFLPAGFYYKTFIHPRPSGSTCSSPSSASRRVWAKRRIPSMATPTGTSISTPMWTSWSRAAGSPGLQAALEAGRAGAKVLLCEQTAHWGGRAPVDGVRSTAPRPRIGSPAPSLS
jgi:sarcosine oxidase subunit alpha